MPSKRTIYKDDWLISDFTLEEIKTLKATNRMTQRNQHLNGVFDKMTFEEIIELQLKLNEECPMNKFKPFPTGLYVETKMVVFYREMGIEISQLIHDVLVKYNIETVEKANNKLPIIIESFEEESLIYFQDVLKSDLP